MRLYDGCYIIPAWSPLSLIQSPIMCGPSQKIKNAEIAHFFTEVITSETSNSLKPNIEIFEFALKSSNATLSESIMIGDNETADIQGGINIGMDTVFVNHLNVAPTLPATYTITHLKELEEIL